MMRIGGRREGSGAALGGSPMFLAAVAVSVAGDLLSSVAVAAYLTTAEGSSSLALYFVVATAVRVVAGPLVGPIVDRCPAVASVVSADVIRGLMFVAVVLGAGSAPPPIALIALAGSTGVVSTFHRCAFARLVAMCVDEHDLERVNARLAGATQVGWLVGPLLGAVVFLEAGMRWALAANAVTFLVAAIATASVAAEIRHRSASAGAADGDNVSTAGDLRGSVARVVAVPALVSSALMLLFGAELVLHPLIAVESLSRDPAVAGTFVTAAGLGGLLGAPLAGRLVRRLTARHAATIAAAATSVMLVALAWSPGLAMALIACAVAGAVGTVFDVAIDTWVQRTADPTHLGRAFGWIGTVDNVVQLAGIGAVAALLRWSSVSVAVLVLTVTSLLVLAGAHIAHLALYQRSSPISSRTEEGGDSDELHPARSPAHQAVNPA